MAKIREDLVGVVSVGGLNLKAGDVVPDGVTVGDHVLAPQEKPKAEPVQTNDGDEVEKPAPKRRGRPRKEY